MEDDDYTWNFQVNKKSNGAKIFEMSVDLSPISKCHFNKNTLFYSTKIEDIVFQE